MWTATLDLDPKRVLITQILRRFWSGASFSSFAPLQMQNLPRQPLPEKTWVRVRNRLAGICGSDLHMIQADGDLRIAPAALPLHRRSYPGHEVVGEVLEVGEDTQYIRVGDRVALQYGSNCLSSGVQTPCRSCAHGYYNLCEYGNLPGPHPIGGGWSEEMLLPEQQLFRIPTEISDEQAVMLEPTAVTLHAVLRHLPQRNERVLIIGAGAIGLLTLQIVRALAPQAEISVLARHAFQIEQATRQGAAHIIYPQDSYTSIQQATNAQMIKGPLNNRILLGGYDVVFDTVGTQKTLHHALRWARTQATVVLVGVNLHPMHIDLTPVWYQEINLIGSMGSSIENWPPATSERHSTFDIVVDLIKRDQIHPELLITHRFPLNNSQTALLTALHKEQNHSIKVLFDYSLLPPSVVPTIRASAPRKRRPRAIDEDTSLPESQNIASVPLPAQPAEPAEPIISLLPLLSSSHTVAPAPYDDELDEMEDTISAPAITKYNKQAPIDQQKEQLSIQPENNIPQKEDVQPEPEVVSSELMPELLPTEPENQVDEMAIPGVVSPELMPEALIIEPENQADETAIPDDTIPTIDEEPSEINAFTDATKIDETPMATASNIQTVDETNDATPGVAEEPLHPLWENDEGRGVTLRTPTSPETMSPETEVQAHERTQGDAPTLMPDDAQRATEEPAEINDSIETIDDADDTATEMIYTSDVLEFPWEQEVTEPYVEAPIDSYFSEDSVAEQNISEFPEPDAQDTSFPADFASQKETDTTNATEQTENALLYTERSSTTNVPNRARPRTRKKNTRPSVERR